MTGPAAPSRSLQNAGALVLENIAARLDRAQEYRPYFRVLLEPPARAVHDSWDYCDMAGRYVDALILLCRMTGLSAEEEEAGLRRFFLRMQDPEDGLFYNQADDTSEYLADMFCQSRALIGLCSWYEETGDAEVRERLRGLVHGLIAVAAERDGYVYYPRNHYRRGEWLEGGLFYTPKDLWSVRPGYGGTQIEGFMQYFRLTGDEAVLPFVRRYLRYFLDAARVVDAEGRYTGHLHSQGIVPTMIGAARYAEATGDRDLTALCVRFLRFTLSQSSAFGWVPDGIDWPTCETCALGDVLCLASELSAAGAGDFWYEIERFARNQLAENQFCDEARIARLLEGRQPRPGVERIVRGAFASWARPNDLLGGPDLEGCCTGGGVRALWHVGSNVVAREPDGAVAVRMLFSVETEEARVESALPDAGRVRIVLKKASRLKVRRPEWSAVAKVDVRVDGREAVVGDGGDWLLLDALPAGVPVDLAFDLPVATRVETVAGCEYRTTWKGSRVVAIDPPGEGYPIYLGTG